MIDNMKKVNELEAEVAVKLNLTTLEQRLLEALQYMIDHHYEDHRPMYYVVAPGNPTQEVRAMKKSMHDHNQEQQYKDVTDDDLYDSNDEQITDLKVALFDALRLLAETVEIIENEYPETDERYSVVGGYAKLRERIMGSEQ